MKLWRWRRQAAENGTAARQARREAERRLQATRRQRPEVQHARDLLADLVNEALRGGRA